MPGSAEEELAPPQGVPAWVSGAMRAIARPWVRAAFLIGLAAFLAYASVRVIHHQRPRASTDQFTGIQQYGDGDWGVYYRAGLAMRLRQPLYTLEHGPLLTFKNPPAVAFFIAPLSMLPVGVARWVWLMGDLVLLAAMYRLAARVIFDRDDPPAFCAMLIGGAVLLSLHYILDELFAGTTAMLYLALTVAAFVWAWEGKPIRSGTALGLAVCLKVVPLAFVPWLLLCRRAGRSLASFAFTLVFLAVLPAIWIGNARNSQLLRQWPRHLAQTEVHLQELRPTNQSLNAMLTRALTPAVPGMARVNVASLSPRAAHAIWLVISCALAAALYGWIFLRLRRGHADAGATLSLLLLYMTLCNPLAWRYTYVATGIALLYCLTRLARARKSNPFVIVLLAAAYLLHFAPEHLQAWSARFWGAVALSGAVVLASKLKSELNPVPGPQLG